VYLTLARAPSHIDDWDRLQDARTVLLIWNLSRFCLFLCRNTVVFTSATYCPLYSRPRGAVVQRVSVFWTISFEPQEENDDESGRCDLEWGLSGHTCAYLVVPLRQHLYLSYLLSLYCRLSVVFVAESRYRYFSAVRHLSTESVYGLSNGSQLVQLPVETTKTVSGCCRHCVPFRGIVTAL